MQCHRSYSGATEQFYAPRSRQGTVSVCACGPPPGAGTGCVTHQINSKIYGYRLFGFAHVTPMGMNAAEYMPQAYNTGMGGYQQLLHRSLVEGHSSWARPAFRQLTPGALLLSSPSIAIWK